VSAIQAAICNALLEIERSHSGRGDGVEMALWQRIGYHFVTATKSSAAMKTPERQWDDVMRGARQLADEQPGQIAYIGGVAVYMHTVAMAETEHLGKTSHDADLMISLVAYSGMRDAHEMVFNSRLSKHQLMLNGEEFDVYVQRRNNLIVPFEDLYAKSKEIDGLRVACLEHLLPLKLEAALQRQASSKGAKDEEDICKICHLAIIGDGFDAAKALPYMRDETVRLLRGVAKGDAPRRAANGEFTLTRDIRRSMQKVLDALLGKPAPKVRSKRHSKP
jgi:hypothetical protein